VTLIWCYWISVFGVGSPQATKPSLVFCRNVKVRQVTHEVVFFFYLSRYLFVLVVLLAINN